MKLNQKFFLISFILIITLILVLGIFMIQYTFNKNLEREKKASINTYNNILNSVYTKLKDLESDNFSIPSFSILAQDISEILGDTLQSYEISNTYITAFLYQNTNLIFGTDIALSNDILNNIYCEDYEVHTYIFKLDNQYILLTYSQISIAEKNYLLITKTNIQDIYVMRQEQSTNFIYIGLSIGSLISIILYTFSYFITKKLSAINIAAKKLSNGFYGCRINNLSGNDEVNELVTSFNNMANSIQLYVNQINKDSQAKQNFINNFLHELRTPLTNIKLSSSLLSTGVIPIDNKEKYSEKLIEINEEIDYINNLTTKLIDLFLLKIDLNTLPLINLSNLVSNVCKQMDKKFKENNIQIKTKITSNIMKRADRALIKSLLINILNNSFKAYSGKPKGIIELQLSNNFIKITDYGKGIPQNELENIFQPFYTLNKSRNKELSGIGLRNTIMPKNLWNTWIPI